MSEEFESDVESPAGRQQDAAGAAPSDREPAAAPGAADGGVANGAGADARALSGPSLASVIDVPLRVSVELGAAKMLVREVLQLNKGSVIPLDRSSGDPADVLVNGKRIARGEVTFLDDALAVRIVELIGRDDGGRGR